MPERQSFTPTPPPLPQPEQARLSVPPSLVRAIDMLRRIYPDDPAIQPSKISAMPMSDPYAWSTVSGATGLHNDVTINPIRLALQPQAYIDEVLAHEIQHVRQNPKEDLYKFIKDFTLPYEQRPSEIDAENARRKFRYESQLPTGREYEDFPVGYDLANQLTRGITVKGK